MSRPHGGTAHGRMGGLCEDQCAIEGCERPRHCRGWCTRHYYRWRRYGDPTASRKPGRVPIDPAIRFFAMVRKSEGCWEWTGTKAYGYGQFTETTSKFGGAHRWSYEYHVGPIPEGLQLDHLCRNRACVNPAHLEPVTARVNTLRGVGPAALNAAKTECIHGHGFTPENTAIAPDGSRKCRTCRRLRNQKVTEQRRAQRVAAALEGADR